MTRPTTARASARARSVEITEVLKVIGMILLAWIFWPHNARQDERIPTKLLVCPAARRRIVRRDEARPCRDLRERLQAREHFLSRRARCRDGRDRWARRVPDRRAAAQRARPGRSPGDGRARP